MLVPEEFYTTTPADGALPKIAPTYSMPRTFGAGTGTLLVGTPVRFDTDAGNWRAWTAGAGGVANPNAVEGFLHPHDLELSEAGERPGVVMLTGKIAYDQIILPEGESQAALDEALRTLARDKGLLVEGLSAVR